MNQYMTTEEVAEYLSIPLNTIYQWRTRGSGPRASRVGRHLRWVRADVDRWVEQRASVGS